MSRVVTVASGLRFNLVRDAVSTYPLLQCGGCEAWLSFSQEQYQGDKPLTCSCGWTAPQHFGGELEAFAASHRLVPSPVHFEELDKEPTP